MGGGFLPDRDPPGQRPPWTETLLDRDPLDRNTPRQRLLRDRDPAGQRPPWTETPLDRDPPVQRLPGQRSPWIEIPIPSTDTPPDRQTVVKTLPSKTSFAGGKNSCRPSPRAGSTTRIYPETRDTNIMCALLIFALLNSN